MAPNQLMLLYTGSKSDQMVPARTGDVVLSSLISLVVNLNLYNEQTFSFTLITLLYSFIIVVTCCTSVYCRDLTNYNVISTELSLSLSFHRYFKTLCRDSRLQLAVRQISVW